MLALALVLMFAPRPFSREKKNYCACACACVAIENQALSVTALQPLAARLTDKTASTGYIPSTGENTRASFELIIRRVSNDTKLLRFT